MNKLVPIFMALSLGACSPAPPPERIIRGKAAEAAVVAKSSIIDVVEDYGAQPEIDGCRLMWVKTNTYRPNFWLVRCPNEKTQTWYDTGGKNPTKAGASVE